MREEFATVDLPCATVKQSQSQRFQLGNALAHDGKIFHSSGPRPTTLFVTQSGRPKKTLLKRLFSVSSTGLISDINNWWSGRPVATSQGSGGPGLWR